RPTSKRPSASPRRPRRSCSRPRRARPTSSTPTSSATSSSRPSSTSKRFRSRPRPRGGKPRRRPGRRPRGGARRPRRNQRRRKSGRPRRSLAPPRGRRQRRSQSRRRPMTQRRAVLVALGLLVLSVHTSAGRQKFSSRTLGVRVDVLVTDGRGPVAGLTDRDFELRDNGVVQRVEVVDSADVPINAVLALDTSASITGKRKSDLISAGEALVDGLKPVDRAGLTTFSHAVTPKIALTSDFRVVRDALHGIDPHGLTSVMDGVYVALAS